MTGATLVISELAARLVVRGTLTLTRFGGRVAGAEAFGWLTRAVEPEGGRRLTPVAVGRRVLICQSWRAVVVGKQRHAQ